MKHLFKNLQKMYGPERMYSLAGTCKHSWLFSVPPPHQNFFGKLVKILLQIDLNTKQKACFKLILKVIVKDSDTNFVHTFSLSSHAFLMKKSTASCFKS